MFLPACIIFGYISAVKTQSTQPSLNQFCVGDVCYIRPDPNIGRNWTDAQGRCKEFSSTLPIVDNPQHQRSFEAAVRHFTTKDERNLEIWIGAKAFNSDPVNWMWVDGSKYYGTDIQSKGEYARSYAYVSVTSAGVTAFSALPTNVFSYICYYPTPADGCTNGTGQTAFYIGDRCYVKYDKQLSWFSARNSCLANNGDLASFDYISRLQGKIAPDPLWVGLRHSQWNWQNAVTGLSSDVTYTLWRSDQPDDAAPSCIITDAFDSFPSWRDWNCNSSSPFVCQVIGNTWSRTTSSTSRRSSTLQGSKSTSASTVSNGVVMEASSPFLTQGASDPSRQTSLGMAIGVAVGIGVPVIAVIIIVVIVIIIRRRRNARETGEQNVRDQSLPQDSLTPPTYMQLNMADKLEKNVYAKIGSSSDYLQPEESTNDSGDVNHSEMSP